MVCRLMRNPLAFALKRPLRRSPRASLRPRAHAPATAITPCLPQPLRSGARYDNAPAPPPTPALRRPLRRCPRTSLEPRRSGAHCGDRPPPPSIHSAPRLPAADKKRSRSDRVTPRSTPTIALAPGSGDGSQEPLHSGTHAHSLAGHRRKVATVQGGTGWSPSRTLEQAVGTERHGDIAVADA